MDVPGTADDCGGYFLRAAAFFVVFLELALADLTAAGFVRFPGAASFFDGAADLAGFDSARAAGFASTLVFGDGAPFGADFSGIGNGAVAAMTGGGGGGAIGRIFRSV